MPAPYKIYTRAIGPEGVLSFDTIAEAEAKREELIRQAMKDTGMSRDGVYLNCRAPSRSYSQCPKCKQWDTLTTAQEAWADVTTCKTDGCDYYSRYSIGD